MLVSFDMIRLVYITKFLLKNRLATRTNSRISHAIWNIKRYRELYGIGKAFKVVLHYAYVGLKKSTTKNPTNLIVNCNGYKLSVIPWRSRNII